MNKAEMQDIKRSVRDDVFSLKPVISLGITRRGQNYKILVGVKESEFPLSDEHEKKLKQIFGETPYVVEPEKMAQTAVHNYFE